MIQSERQYFSKFDKTGCLLLIVEVTHAAYRASVWSFNRHSHMDLVAHSDLELQTNCLSIAMLESKS